MIAINENQKKRIREACQVAATVLDRMVRVVEPGMSTYDLDQYGREQIEELGAESACYKYKVKKVGQPYPAHTCLSVNNEIVHGIGRKDRILEEGDIISVDVCTRYRGFIGDNCRTVPVGAISPEAEKLLKVTEESMHLGIKKAMPKASVAEIAIAVQRHVEDNGFSVVRQFVGHGVGRKLHDAPQIPNFYEEDFQYQRLKRNMVVCIEPMVNAGGYGIKIADDEWTALTSDNSLSAHFENTVLITAEGPEILTVPMT